MSVMCAEWGPASLGGPLHAEQQRAGSVYRRHHASLPPGPGVQLRTMGFGSTPKALAQCIALYVTWPLAWGKPELAVLSLTGQRTLIFASCLHLTQASPGILAHAGDGCIQRVCHASGSIIYMQPVLSLRAIMGLSCINILEGGWPAEVELLGRESKSREQRLCCA